MGMQKLKKNEVSVLNKTCDLGQECNPITQMDVLNHAIGKT